MTIVATERDYSLSQYEGWKTRFEAPRRTKPAELTIAEIGALDRRDLLVYNDQRSVWHANLGPYLTPEMLDVIDQLDLIVQSNRQDGDRVRSAAVLDAYPGLGKTTLAVHYGGQFHRDQMDMYGPTTDSGDDRIPVAYVRLTSNTTMRSLNSMLCHFYAHPAADRGNATVLGARAAQRALESTTRLIVVDDVHFLDMNRRDGREVANHFKWLANEFAATFLFVGVGIAERGLLSEGLSPTRVQYAQTARRWTRTSLSPFGVDDAHGRKTWRRLLLAIERDIILANKSPGMVADDLADYLYARSTGHFASLMTLLARGCQRAIKTGAESLTIELLDTVPNDEASEQARRQLEASLRSGRLNARRAAG